MPNKRIYRALSVTRDLQLDLKLSDCIASNSKYFTARSSSTAAKLIDKYSYDVIFIDEDLYNDETHTEDKSEWLDELYTKAAINDIIKKFKRIIIESCDDAVHSRSKHGSEIFRVIKRYC